ncbi:hypothetical protein UlMin_039366 [Ulmus minor]
MIQELLGGAGLIGGERKISINGRVLESTPSPSSSTNTATATTSSAATTTTSNLEILRCPRCDSSNTKFCYYNNYNLTQPRHFCKTCRRYWTKGGALRNVPIGGGCRKNKSSPVSAASVGKTTAGGKMKMVATEIGRSGFGGGFDHHEINSSPILWGSPQNSHLLALLRSAQNPNPNPNPIGSHTLGLDPVGQVPSLNLCSSFWRNNNNNNQNQNPQFQQNGFVLGEAQNSNGIQELYQRLRSSANYYNDNSSVVLSHHLASSSSPSSTTSSILESAPVAAGGGELGFSWNPALSAWSDLPTTNGAYP